jgi:hypothetical protein
MINPLNTELNPISHLLALTVGHHFVHVSRIRVKEWKRMSEIATACNYTHIDKAYRFTAYRNVHITSLYVYGLQEYTLIFG